jgi:hypothetical protein
MRRGLRADALQRLGGILYYFDLRFVNFVDFGLREGRKFLFRFVGNF